MVESHRAVLAGEVVAALRVVEEVSRAISGLRERLEAVARLLPAPAVEPAPAPPAPHPAPTAPPEPPSAAAPPVVERADPGALAKLQAHFQGAGAARPPAPPPPVPSLDRTLASLAPAVDLATPAGRRAEARRLQAVLQELPCWAAQDPSVNRALCTWIAARARALNDGDHPNEASLERSWFAAVGAHTKASRPGVIHGLAKAHEPQRGAWSADAVAAGEAVRQLLAPRAEELPAFCADDELRRLTEACDRGLTAADFVPWVRRLVARGLSPKNKRLVGLAAPFVDELPEDLSRLRQAVTGRAPTAPAQGSEGERASDGLPDDWPGFAWTRGKRAALVGGEPRPERASALQERFEFASLDWVDLGEREGPRLDALIARMGGSVDLVIALRAYSRHGVTQKVFRAATADCPAVLADTYGAQAIRLALERFLSDRQPTADPTADPG